ncbi:Detected protein of confused Function [Hibiscus syriacus]|uniref:Detected protein of confused Function n=1 Tax=Hibiscus syriacus TaxID=106335 RepID=A0A6A2Y4H5_HIBSY|nr:Detected protein of confused Function [Hibiscus syriacus]
MFYTSLSPSGIGGVVHVDEGDDDSDSSGGGGDDDQSDDDAPEYRLVRSLEAEGLSSKQAEAITAAMTEVLNDSLENVSVSVVSKLEMQKGEMTQESNVSKLKSEVHSCQELHYSLLQHENEELQKDIEKIRSELRHEIDKVNAGQRLDLNLERGRIRDELSNQHAGTASLTNKLDREIHELKAHLEAAKYDLIKYCISTLVSLSAVGLAVVRVVI